MPLQIFKEENHFLWSVDFLTSMQSVPCRVLPRFSHLGMLHVYPETEMTRTVIIFVNCPSTKVLTITNIVTVWKVSKYGVFSGPYFPAFWRNTERYSVSLSIQSKWGKIRTRKKSVFGHLSRSECYGIYLLSIGFFTSSLCHFNIALF